MYGRWILVPSKHDYDDVFYCVKRFYVALSQFHCYTVLTVSVTVSFFKPIHDFHNNKSRTNLNRDTVESDGKHKGQKTKTLPQHEIKTETKGESQRFKDILSEVNFL